MSEHDVNNNNYEMPTNDVNNSSGDKNLVSGSSLADTINAAGSVDPTRFWVVIMIGLFICVVAAVVAGGGYLVDEGRKKDVEIKELKAKLEACPQKTLEDFRRQRETIEQLRLEVLREKGNIEELKQTKLEDVNALEKINNKLESMTP